MNSDLFKSINYEYVNLITTPATSLDNKIFSVTINANIKDLRPEAFLESENIEIGLKESEILDSENIEYSKEDTQFKGSIPRRLVAKSCIEALKTKDTINKIIVKANMQKQKKQTKTTDKD